MALQSDLRRTRTVCHHARSGTQLLGSVSGNVSASRDTALKSGCHRTRKVCPHAGRGAASGNVSAFPALQSGNSGILSAVGDSTLQSGNGTWWIASANFSQSLPAPQCLTLPKCRVLPAHMLARCCQRLLCLQPPLPQAPALPHLLGVASTVLVSPCLLAHASLC